MPGGNCRRQDTDKRNGAFMGDISEEATLFLQELYRRYDGNPAGTFSMFEIGQTLGLEREKAGAVGEELIGWGLVEVRTLSGGVAIAESGIEKVRQLSGQSTGQDDHRIRLGADPVLELAGRDAVDCVLSRLKANIGDLSLGFERLSEIMADLKSIEAQLSSPRPKTAIVREGFRSMLEVLEAAGAAQQFRALKELLDE